MILNLKKGNYKIRTRDKVGPYILQFTRSAVPLEFKISSCVSVTFEMIIIHIPSGVLSHAGKKITPCKNAYLSVISFNSVSSSLTLESISTPLSGITSLTLFSKMASRRAFSKSFLCCARIFSISC